MITCHEGFTTKWPPFLGDVKIVDLDVTPHVVEYMGNVMVEGRAMIKKFTPMNPWVPFDDADVHVMVDVHTDPPYDEGTTDSEGYFSIDIEPPYPPAQDRAVGVYKILVELPKPEGGVPTHHLTCGPIGLIVVPDESMAKCMVVE